MSDACTGNMVEKVERYNYYRYVWTIPNFCVCHRNHGNIALKSPDFKVEANENNVFHLKLLPLHQVNAVHQYTSLYRTSDYISLHLVSSNTFSDFYIGSNVVFSILDSHGRKYSSKEFIIELCEIKVKGFNEFCLHSDLHQNCTMIPSCGILTIMCEITPTKTEISEQSLSSDLKLTLNNQKFSDLTLVVEEQEIRVHKVILASRSPVFAAMLESNMAEKEKNKVDITDIDYETMKHVLLYIYTGNVENTDSELARKLLAPADKYALDGLKNRCGVFLSEALTVENAFETLLLADLYRVSALKTNAVNFIAKNFGDVMADKEGFKLIVEKHPNLLEEFLCLIGHKMKI